MKRYWITIGVVVTITGILWAIGEVVQVSRTDVLSAEVSNQLDKIDGSFDEEALDRAYFGSDDILVDRTDLD